MLIDNENKNLKVHEWITKYTENGTLDIVTGYFTVGALAYLAQKTKDNIDAYKFILGDIVNIDEVKDRALDLMNENIRSLKTWDKAFKKEGFQIDRKSVQYIRYYLPFMFPNEKALMNE